MGGYPCGSANVSSPSSWYVSPTPSSITYNYNNGYYNSIRVKWNSAVSAIVRASYTCSNSGSWGTTSNLNLSISSSATPSVGLSLSSTNACYGGGSITLTASQTNGGSSPSYTYYVDGVSVYNGSASSYTYSTSGLAAGNHSAYVMLHSSHPCVTSPSATSSSQSFTVTNKASYTASISGPGLICSGTSTITLYANVNGGVGNLSYQWYVNGAPSWGGSSFTTNATHGNSIYCKVYSDYWCVNSPAQSNTYTVNVTNSVTPTVSVQISPKLNFCPGENITFTASSSYITSSSTYAWYLNGNLVSVPNTSQSIVLPSSSAYAAGHYYPGSTVSVTVNGLSGTCLSSTSASGSTSAAGVYTLPTASAASQSICSGSTTSISISNPNGVSGTTYSWTASASNVTGASNGTGSLIAQTLSSTNGVSNGTVTYTITPSANGCTGPSTTATVTVKPIPNASASSQSICSGQATSISISNPNGVSGTTFSWTVSQVNATGGLSGSGSTISQALSSTTSSNGTVTYMITPSANGCTGATVSPVVTVKPLPNASAASQSICSGTTSSITISNPNGVAGTVFNWTVAQSNVTGGTSGTGNSIAQTLTAAASSAGTATYTITPSANGCAGSPISPVVTVKPIPNASAANDYLFSGDNTSISISNPNAVSGTTFSWIVSQSNITGASSGSGNTIQQVLETSNGGTATYTITPAANGCSGVPVNSTATVYALPVITSPSTRVILGGVALSTGVGYDTYTWHNSANTVVGSAQSFNAATADSYTVTVTKMGASGRSLPFTLSDQFSDQDANYIVSFQALDDISPGTVLESLPLGSVTQSVQYFDGLGRPIQTVVTQGSPTAHDVVQPTIYDQFGREARKYLPFVATENTGRLKQDVINPVTHAYQNAAANFYTSGAGGIPIDTQPYAKIEFEPSPLNRILKQGAPGSDWQPDASPYETTTDHSIKLKYLVNDATDVLKWSYTPPTTNYPFGQIDAGTSASPVKYAANELYKNKTKDENQHEVITFTDKQDRIILKKVQGPGSTWAETYYIYDDYGRLVTVVPPEATARLSGEYLDESAVAQESFMQLWAFRYRYDRRSRMVLKQVPGADSVAMVYDNRDRLVMTQDGNQRNAVTKEWTFTKYDVFNRPVLTGKFESTNSRKSMQNAVDAYYSEISAGEAWFETYQGTSGAVLGYSNASFPNVSVGSDYYTAIYYDTYDAYIAPAGYTYLNESLEGQEASPFSRVKGKQTGAKIINLTTGTWMRTVNYYDDRYRVIQSIADHHKGTVRTSNVYDFAKLLTSKRSYVVNSVSKTIKETYTYDHAGRLLTVKHSVDGAAEVMIAKNEYNELGQLIDKKLHSTDGGSTFAQSVDHRYNIRGWLTKINEADVGSVASGDSGYDHFGMELVYNGTASGLSTTQMYNGNISAIKWSKGNGGTVGKQAYTFKYDPMNRLEEGSHFDYVATSWESNSRSFQEKIHQYDLNGNIMKLSRRQFGGMLMDSLEYSYTGNRLSYVHDYGNQVEGFVNANISTDDYDYDFNGNMDQDKNKGLVSKGNVKYNHLNLPYEIIKGTESIRYVYDATGRKLAQEVYSDNGGTLVKYTDYIGELVYEGNSLIFMQHLEGRVLPDAGGWEYQYHLKDHLGNVRVTFTAKPQAPVNYQANFETGTTDSGETDFGNYTSANYDLVDHTDTGSNYQGVQWLNGGASGRVGLTKSLSVMPGDRVSVTAYAKYMNLSGTGNPNAFATALTSAFGVSSASMGEGQRLYSSLNDYAVGVAGGEHSGDDDMAPKAFVTILLFDRQFNLLDAAWDQITTDDEQVSATVKESFGYPLSKEITVQEAGYAYIFLSNEHPTYVDVYFDDVAVSHTTSPIVSSSDYFPFGLSYNVGVKEDSPQQKYLFNGKELQDELAINWYDYGARMYMPEIGRWGVLDPMAELARRWTPYRYGFDNPLRFIDPDGMFEVSDGYSTMDSRNVTGAMSASGTFVGSEKDLKMGSSASTRVYATLTDGSTVEVKPGDFGKASGLSISQGAGASLKAGVGSFSAGFSGWLNRQRKANQQRNDPQQGSTPDAFFEGVPVYGSEFGDLKNGAAVTLPGIGIFVNPKDLANVHLLRHEFGHILQARKYGMQFFYSVIAPASLASAASKSGDHQKYWTEVQANTFAYYYFNAPADWKLYEYPIDMKYIRHGDPLLFDPTDPTN